MFCFNDLPDLKISVNPKWAVLALMTIAFSLAIGCSTFNMAEDEQELLLGFSRDTGRGC